MQNSQDININFTNLPTLLANFKQGIEDADAKKPFDGLILQANEFYFLLKTTMQHALERQKVSQQISAFDFINALATELLDNIEKELKKLPDNEDKEFENLLNHLKNIELKNLKEHFEKAKHIMSPLERYELLKNSGIKMLNENYAEFHSPGQLGRAVAKFCEVFKSDGFGGVSFNVHTPPLTDTESEQIRGNTKTIQERKEEYLIAIFENAAKHGYPPSAVEITLDGKKYSHDDELFKKSISEWEKTAATHNKHLVDNTKEHIEGYRSPGP
jgi:hypothetical protein